MKYNTYIKDSVLVSEIGLGAWQLGNNSGWKGVSEKQAIEHVHRSLDLGVNFFDTAPNYGFGSGEERLGKALKGKDRTKYVLNTKFGHTHRGDLNFSSDYIRESLEGSLRRLQVDYVDSLIIHNPPQEYLDGNKSDHYETLDELVKEGKIKAYGASLDTYDDMKLLLDTTNSKVIEVFFNVLHQDAARGFNIAQEKEVGIIVKIPLDSGWLTGKYNAESRFNDIRSRWSEADIRTRARLVSEIKKLIGANENYAQKAIAFCLAYDAVSTVIPGSVTISQLISNVQSSNAPISDALKLKLEVFYHDEVAKLNLPW